MNRKLKETQMQDHINSQKAYIGYLEKGNEQLKKMRSKNCLNNLRDNNVAVIIIWLQNDFNLFFQKLGV